MQEVTEPQAWPYGSAGDEFPVQDRQIIAVGPHLLACGDLEREDALGLIAFSGRNPTVTYADPPYNDGQVKSFRTKNGQQLQAGYNLDTLLAHVLRAARTSTSGEAWVETGLASEARLRQAMLLSGGKVEGRYPITYYRQPKSKHPQRAAGWPALLLRCVWGDAEPLEVTPAGMDDAHTPDWVTLNRTQPGDTVFDPCAGRGITILAAHKRGRLAVAMELNPRRLAVAIAALVKAGAGAPKVVGEL